jgi:AraC-like DNA-binding protein
MDDGYHQETGLTIRTLAEKLQHPEHQLRRLINGHLQYRNFSAFLNSYRIAAAKRQLADAERVRVPVLTLALELGYASLGPFNRAFKAETGTTPSEYRQRVLIQRAADSE